MGRKIAQQLPPRLTTRARNKDTHPAAAVGLAPKLRGSREEIQRRHALSAQEKKDKIVADAQARLHAAEIEDRLRQEDIDRERIANHPPDPSSPFRAPETTDERVLVTVNERLDMSDDDSGQEYRPPSAPESDTDESKNEVESEDDDDIQQVHQASRRQQRKPRRDDISALRHTTVASVTNTGGKRKAEYNG
ncbi:hypothetical protein H0H92_008158 [Tricholoma furcatifolium]|nr:hypothetical protein H0H92_008158 [Tricholoma furcatifolium]